MIVKNAELETVCGITSKLPENGQIEVAFAGKSNVGKSSLINGLMNRKSLARTSSAPGKTQTINFYAVTGRRETKKEAQGMVSADEKVYLVAALPEARVMLSSPMALTPSFTITSTPWSSSSFWSI